MQMTKVDEYLGVWVHIFGGGEWGGLGVWWLAEEEQV